MGLFVLRWSWIGGYNPTLTRSGYLGRNSQSIGSVIGTLIAALPDKWRTQWRIAEPCIKRVTWKISDGDSVFKASNMNFSFKMRITCRIKFSMQEDVTVSPYFYCRFSLAANANDKSTHWMRWPLGSDEGVRSVRLGPELVSGFAEIGMCQSYFCFISW